MSDEPPDDPDEIEATVSIQRDGIRPESDLGGVWVALDDPQDAEHNFVIHSGNGTRINMEMIVTILDDGLCEAHEVVESAIGNNIDGMFRNEKRMQIRYDTDLTDVTPVDLTATLSPKFEPYIDESVLKDVERDFDDPRVANLTVKFDLVEL
jgi:hypothetical protein